MARAAIIPQSPPKKATRGRPPKTTAAKTTDTETENLAVTKPKSKTTKAAATKSGDEVKKNKASRTASSSASRASKKGDLISDDGTDGGEKRAAKSTTRGRPKSKTTATRTATRTTKECTFDTVMQSDSDDDELAGNDMPKRRPGRPRKDATTGTTANGDVVDVPPKTRGRPRSAKAADSSHDKQKGKTTGTRKQTRTPVDFHSPTEPQPTQLVVTTNSVMMRSNILRGPAKKKTVTFQDLSDSEEEVLEPVENPIITRRKAAAASESRSGLGARPVRKPAATTTRGRKPAAAATDVPQPLSPKKAKQVAKGNAGYASSDDEEDELSGAKTPLKLVVRSPVRFGAEQSTGLSSPVRKINFNSGPPTKGLDENGDFKFQLSKPLDLNELSALGSPARRPPASPFHFTIKELPRKCPLPINERKVTAASMDLNASLQSPLKSSPKKGNLGASFSGSPFKASSTPLHLHARLLQSPAKRIASPFKRSATPLKATMRTMDEDENEDDAEKMEVGAEEDTGGESTAQREHTVNDKRMVESRFSPINEECSDETDDELAVGEGTEDRVRIHSTSTEMETSHLWQAETETIEERDGGKMSELDDHVSNDQMGEGANDHDDEMEDSEPEMQTDNLNAVQELGEPESDEDVDLATFEAEESLGQRPSSPVETAPQTLEDVFTEALVPSRHFTEQLGDAESQPMADTRSQTQDEELHVQELIEEDDEDDNFDARFDDDDELTLVAVDPNEVYMRTPGRMTPGRRASRRLLQFDDNASEEVMRSTRRDAPSVPVSIEPAPIHSSPSVVVDDEGQMEEIDQKDLVAARRDRQSTSHEEETAEELEHQESNVSEMRFMQPPDCSFEPSLDSTPLVQQPRQWRSVTSERPRAERPRRRNFLSLASRPSMGTPRLSIGRAAPSHSRLPDRSVRPTLHVEEVPGEQSATLEDGPTCDEADRVAQEEDQEEISGLPLRNFAGPVLTLDGDSIYVDNVESPVIGEDYGSPAPGSMDDDKDNDNKENEADAPQLFATPVQPRARQTQTFHTVCKVPLRPEGFLSPLKLSRKRPRSLSSTSPLRVSPRLRAWNVVSKEGTTPILLPKAPSSRVMEPTNENESEDEAGPDSDDFQRNTGNEQSQNSPVKTPRRNMTAEQQILRGAVVFVDVHTTEGEDASGIFVELLQQMGAKCVRNWTWNPHSSMSPVDGADPKESRIGITHVVYKDGGVRILEKVRQAAGVVKCVGVGWVLDCERENKWLDEAHYAVDSSIIPRGGAKRRKSMQPRALSNVNGTLVHTPSSSGSAGRRRSGADWGAMENFRRHSPSVLGTPDGLNAVPTDHNQAGSSAHNDDSDEESGNEADTGSSFLPQTPGSTTPTTTYAFNFDTTGISPATPFYLSQRSKLVQQTCPPKQTLRGLFSPAANERMGGRDGDGEFGPQLRFKLEAARRKTLVFKPKIRSPLTQ